MTKRIVLACALIATLAGCKPTLEFKSDKSTIPHGEDVSLEWNVDFAKGSSSREIEISKVGDGLEEEGAVSVSPVKTTKYELKAKANVYGFPVVAKDTVTVTVSDDAYSWDLGDSEDSTVWEEWGAFQSSAISNVQVQTLQLLPSETNSTAMTTKITMPDADGNDPLFAFLIAEIPSYISLDADEIYSISYEIILTTDINSACSAEEDIDDRPITSYLKVGVLRSDPTTGIANEFTNINFDTSTGIDLNKDSNIAQSIEEGIGSISSDNGLNVSNIGKIQYSNSEIECEPGKSTHQKITMRQTTPISIKTDKNGKLWFLAGIHSLAEDSTDYYVMEISMTIEEQ